MGLSSESQIEARPVTIRRTVKWGECDPAGVVYTPRFADYAISAFQYFLAEILGSPLQQHLDQLGLGLPMKAMSFEFRRSLWPDQVFEMKVYVGDIRTRSFDLKIEGRLETGEVSFIALLSPICINPKLRTSIKIPEFLQERLVDYSLQTPGPGMGPKIADKKI